MLYKYTSKEAKTSITSWPLRMKTQSPQKSKLIYRYKYDRVECDEENIGDYAKLLQNDSKNVLKAPSPIYEHSNMRGLQTSMDNFSIVGRESQSLTRTRKEAKFLRVNVPSLNRNIDK